MLKPDIETMSDSDIETLLSYGVDFPPLSHSCFLLKQQLNHDWKSTFLYKYFNQY